MNHHHADLACLQDVEFGGLASFDDNLLGMSKFLVEFEQYSIESSFSERFEEGEALEHVSVCFSENLLFKYIGEER